MRKKRSLFLAIVLVLSVGYVFQQYGFPTLLKDKGKEERTVKAEKTSAALLPKSASQEIKPPSDPPVANVQGKVRLQGAGDNLKTLITLFNGFEPVSEFAQQDGSYNIPLSRSSEGTFISVFASQDSFAPQVRNVRLSFKRSPASRLPVVEVPEMVLELNPRNDLGTLIGVAYVRTVSGRPSPFEGILKFDPGQQINIAAQSGQPGAPTIAPTTNIPQIKVQAKDDGSYSTQLPPGKYRIITDRNILIDDVEIVNGRTTVIPIFSGEQINF